MSERINILLADDHKVFADGLAGLLQQHTDNIDDIFIAGNKTDTLLLFQKHTIHVAFIDIEFGKDDGRKVAVELSQKYPDCKYVALSSHAEPSIIKSALKGAFNAYILKTDSLETIINCIEHVLSGEKFISPDSGTTLLNELAGNTQKSLTPKLTKREKEILESIAKEMSTKDIAAHLFISEKTVEAHRSNLMMKLDAKNAAGLIRRAFETGLLN